jgi:RES domain
MPVNQALATQISAGTPYFRITSPSFYTKSAARHVRVVNGQGGIRNNVGSRYAFPNSRSVYLTEDVNTCLAERMFYFHREILPALDKLHINGVLPPFTQMVVLWEVRFKKSIPDVADVTIANAPAFNVIPSLMQNPSQDYLHLKQRRADIQSHGYYGLRAPSSRAGGNMVVLFDDQSKNVASIVGHPVDLQLMTSSNPPTVFANHATQLLSFDTGDVRFPQNAPPNYVSNAWSSVAFNH